MELQGNAVEKLDSDKKEKMEATLSDMEKIREKDSIQLRQKAVKLIEHFKKQINNADIVEKNLRGQLEQLRIKRNRIEGAITALKDLINPEVK